MHKVILVIPKHNNDNSNSNNTSGCVRTSNNSQTYNNNAPNVYEITVHR